MVDLRPLLFANALLIMVALILGFAGLQGSGAFVQGLAVMPWQSGQATTAGTGPATVASPLPLTETTPAPGAEQPTVLVTLPRNARHKPSAENSRVPASETRKTSERIIEETIAGNAEDNAGELLTGSPSHSNPAPVVEMALLRLSANVEQSRIRINGQDSGLGEATLTLPPGKHHIHFSKPGHAPWQQQIELAPGDDRRLTARLEPYTRVHYRNGEWRHDLVSGEGSYRNQQGLYYEGEFRKKAFHGQGEARWPDGRRYRGDWVDGKMQGYGELHEADGSHYRGELHNHRFHGRGTLTTAQGDRYTGQWSRGKLNGHGVLSFRDGTLYVGELRDGRFHGEGTLTFADGRVYQGEFADNQYHGQGSRTFRSGRRYTGRFAYGEFHGPGTLSHPNGGRITGTFREGEAYGEVRLTTPQGERFIARTSEPGVCYREESYRATQCPPMDGW